MRNVMLAGLGAVFLWAGTAADADPGADPETGACTLEVASGVTDAWMGDCENGKAHGEGVAILPNGTYSGSAADGRADGKGRLTYSGGGRYEGDWVRGKRHGRGSMVDADGDRYEGEFADGLPHGQGSGSTPGGGHHVGEWRHGEPVPEPEATDMAAAAEMDAETGAAVAADSESGPAAGAGRDCKLQMAGEALDWSGECRDGKAHGEGTAAAPDGSATYSGHAEGGKPHGRGTVTTAGGGYYQGGFRHGMHHGEAIIRGPDGKLYLATFVDGEQSGDAVPMEGVAAADPWGEQADAGTAPSPDGTARPDDDPWARSDWEEPDPWGEDSTAAGSETAGSRVPGGDAGASGADDFDYNEALRALDGEDGIVRSAIPTEYEAALEDLDRQERLEAERRKTEIAREAEDYARQVREDIEAETARERRAEAQRQRERRDAELTERVMRLEQERQAEKRERRSQALLERNLQIAALQRTLDFNLVACGSATPPSRGLRWVPNRDTSAAAQAAARQAWQAEVERFRGDCRTRAQAEYQTAIGTLMLTNP